MNVKSDKNQQERRATMIILFGGLLWGLYWIPLRLFGSGDLDGPWPSFIIFAVAVLILLPIAIFRAKSILMNLRSLAVVGLLTGAAFAFYSTAFMMTDVVRVIMLFYLTPIWSTVLGVAFLGERLTRGRLLALFLAMSGLAVIATQGDGRALGLGDLIAFISGFFWAFGSTGIYRQKHLPTMDTVFLFALGSLFVTGILILFLGQDIGPTPMGSQIIASLPVGILCGIYVVPVLWVTIWPAKVIMPARLGLLFMSEVVVGSVSAALFAGEHFGWAEGIAMTLIIGAAAVEVLFKDPVS